MICKRQADKNIVDVERFAGLNVRGFNPNEVFAEILSRYLGQTWLLFIHGKTFAVTLENRENAKV